MDTITIEGRVYVKISRAAERTGYAKDYIGQLARGKKVRAVLVGRTWYVVLSELQDYKKEGARSNKEKTKAAVRRTIANSEGDSSEEGTHTITLRRSLPHQSSFQERLMKAEVRYTSDPDPLVPNLSKQTASISSRDADITERNASGTVEAPHSVHPEIESEGAYDEEAEGRDDALQDVEEVDPPPMSGTVVVTEISEEKKSELRRRKVESGRIYPTIVHTVSKSNKQTEAFLPNKKESNALIKDLPKTTESTQADDAEKTIAGKAEPSQKVWIFYLATLALTAILLLSPHIIEKKWSYSVDMSGGVAETNTAFSIKLSQ